MGFNLVTMVNVSYHNGDFKSHVHVIVSVSFARTRLNVEYTFDIMMKNKPTKNVYETKILKL